MRRALSVGSSTRSAGQAGRNTDYENEETITQETESLAQLARQLRYDVLDMTGTWGGHPSSCFSAVEIMTALYFGGILRYEPAAPWWPQRDRFILSKGHAAPLLYAVLAHAKYMPLDELKRFRQRGSGLHGHPIQASVPGVEMTSGSLGQGLSFGLGQVLAGRLAGLDYRLFVLMGDGECEEGQVWEAAMAATHYHAGRLIAIVDHNKYQQTGPISRELSLSPLAEKWLAFGWRVEEVDGHDVGAMIEKLRKIAPARAPTPGLPADTGEICAPLSIPDPGPPQPSQVGQGHGTLGRGEEGGPSVLIAHTVKGKGVSFMEDDYTWHGRPLTPEQDARAREEIRATR